LKPKVVQKAIKRNLIIKKEHDYMSARGERRRGKDDKEKHTFKHLGAGNSMSTILQCCAAKEVDCCLMVSDF
jgi:hypothetical protein